MRLRSGHLLLLIALVFPLLLQGSRGLLEPDEGRYAEVAREMLTTGDWLVPHLDGEPHFTKPPVTYWLTATGLAALGRNAWGARVMLGLATGLTALGAGLIARRLWGPRALWPATVIHLVSFGPFVGGAILTTDAFLVLGETAAVLGFVEAWAGGPRHRRWTAVMGAGFGVAFLTKGPPGLLPLLAIGAFAIWRGPRHPDARRRLWSPAGLAAGLAIGLAWYVAVVLRTPGLAGYFLSEEVVARVATAHHHRDNPAAIYLAALIVGFLPWSLALPWLSGGWSATLARLGRRLLRPGDDRLRFLLLWFLLPLVMFALARSRLPLYVLPLFVPLAVGAAGLLCGRGGGEASAWTGGAAPAARRPAPRSLVAVAVPWALGLLLLKGAAAWWIPWQQDMRYLDRELRRLAPGARAVEVGDEPLHGLRFYRDGDLADWADGPGEPPIGLAAGLRLAAARAAGDHRPCVFVARRGADWMVRGFAAVGVPQVADVRGRRIYLMSDSLATAIADTLPAGPGDDTTVVP